MSTVKPSLFPDRITCMGKKYIIRFPDLIPPLSRSEFDDLTSSIARNGVIVPIVIDHEDRVIDGGHRLLIAAQLGIAGVPFDRRTGLTDEQARILALELNLHRRHLDVEQRKELIAARIKADPTIPDAKIAADIGCHRTTVANVRKELARNNPEVQLARRSGQDGKSYPGTMPIAPLPGGPFRCPACARTFVRPVWECCGAHWHPKVPRCPKCGGERPLPEADYDLPGRQDAAPVGKPTATVHDQCGRAVTGDMAVVFGPNLTEFRSVDHEIGRLKSRIEALAGQPGGKRLVLSECLPELAAAQRNIRYRRPYCVCPDCDGKGCKPCSGHGYLRCKPCGGHGYLTEGQQPSLTDEARRKIDQHKDES